MLKTNVKRSDVATKAVQVAKSLAARGCVVFKFKVSYFGTCYVGARLNRVKFCIRVSDHYNKESKSPLTYQVRVDDPSKGTNEPLGDFVRRLYLGESV